ncbi:MAG: Y-family DNA polymerase [Muribaculaceae bacterium]|nr:Y-family DNA polymerase [Muribaculaceae bacterium]
MVGLVDCDNFFCSCERVFRPDLARVPLVVLSNNDGCVVARSAEAKKMGVREGLPYYQLLEQFPDGKIVAFSSNYTLYGDLSARIMQILRDEAPDVIQYSIDEAFLVLDGVGEDGLKQWGERLCAKVLRYTGMPVSLGIAPSKTLAKVASRYAKKYPGYRKCCLMANETQRRKALESFPVEDVWGIGRRISASLQMQGVTTALQFASLPKDMVRKRYHVTGEQTWRELNGEDVIRLECMSDTKKKTIMTSRSFPGMLTEMADLGTHVANYAARCAVKLRRQQSVCEMVTVFIQSNHFREDLLQYDASASHTFATATATTGELVNASLRLLEKIYRQGIYYKRAGVMVSGVGSALALQPDLFEFNPAERAKQMNVCAALDSINGRMGADTVVLGAQQYRQKSADGKSVKFVNAIRRALKSPDYTTVLGSFEVC